MDPRVRHAIFHHMGLRLLNIAYVQPPLAADQEKCNTLLLCVYLSPKIPSYQQGGETVYYLPTATVRYVASPQFSKHMSSHEPTPPGIVCSYVSTSNFYQCMWKTSIERGRLTPEELAADVDYKRTLMQMSRQKAIRLLDLPWERPWYLIELSEDFDRSLLVRFHSELVAPHTQPEGTAPH